MKKAAFFLSLSFLALCPGVRSMEKASSTYEDYFQDLKKQWSVTLPSFDHRTSSTPAELPHPSLLWIPPYYQWLSDPDSLTSILCYREGTQKYSLDYPLYNTHVLARVHEGNVDPKDCGQHSRTVYCLGHTTESLNHEKSRPTCPIPLSFSNQNKSDQQEVWIRGHWLDYARTPLEATKDWQNYLPEPPRYWAYNLRPTLVKKCTTYAQYAYFPEKDVLLNYVHKGQHYDHYVPQGVIFTTFKNTLSFATNCYDVPWDHPIHSHLEWNDRFNGHFTRPPTSAETYDLLDWYNLHTDTFPQSFCQETSRDSTKTYQYLNAQGLLDLDITVTQPLSYTALYQLTQRASQEFVTPLGKLSLGLYYAQGLPSYKYVIGYDKPILWNLEAIQHAEYLLKNDLYPSYLDDALYKLTQDVFKDHIHPHASSWQDLWRKVLQDTQDFSKKHSLNELKLKQQVIPFEQEKISPIVIQGHSHNIQARLEKELYPGRNILILNNVVTEDIKPILALLEKFKKTHKDFHCNILFTPDETKRNQPGIRKKLEDYQGDFIGSVTRTWNKNLQESS